MCVDAAASKRGRSLFLFSCATFTAELFGTFVLYFVCTYTILKELAELKASLVVQWIAIFTSGRIYLTKWKSSNWPSGTTHVKIWRRNQFTQGSGLFEAWTCFTWIWVKKPSQWREPALQGTPILRGKVPPEQYIFLEKFLPLWNCCWGCFFTPVRHRKIPEYWQWDDKKKKKRP